MLGRSEGAIYLTGVADGAASSKVATVFKIVKAPTGEAYVGDDTFGFQGESQAQLGLGIDNGSEAFGAVELAGGKVIMTGHLRRGVAYDFWLYGLTAAGLTDTTFGPDGDGRVTTDVGGTVNFTGAYVAVPQGGKLLAAGLVDLKVAVVGYTSTGALDTGFGTGGKLVTAFQAEKVAYSPETTKLVGLSRANGKTRLVRTALDGTPDATFGTGGGRDMDVPATFSAADLTVLPDGRIIVLGAPAIGGKIIVLRFAADGSVDKTFGTAGVASLDLGADLQNPAGTTLTRAKDGKSLFVGGLATSASLSTRGVFVAKIEL